MVLTKVRERWIKWNGKTMAQAIRGGEIKSRGKMSTSSAKHFPLAHGTRGATESRNEVKSINNVVTACAKKVGCYRHGKLMYKIKNVAQA